ncbi:MAG TPA: arginine--tRNA ligase [Candidatus Eisenbacteria bacterium]|nr:arginine--tRNA ligase [Candidatus Eisenbacteria bacterium]
MTTLEKAKQQVAEALRNALPEGASVSADELARPPQADMGDLSFPCFGLAKSLKQNPAQLAKDAAAKIVPLGLIGDARAVGHYVNVSFDKRAFATAGLEEVFGRAADFGNAEGKKDGRVMIEYGSPNTHKEIHVGHLRNFALGLSVERLLRAAGHEVIPVNYIGDVGAHVAKWLWYYDKVRKGEVPGAEPIGDDITHFGRIYTAATVLAESDEDKYKPEISAVLQALEKHEPAWESLWLKTRDACLKQMDVIFKELGIRFERTYLESEVEGPGKALVQDLIKRGIAKEGERGAIIVDLAEPEDLGVYLVLKSDGTALYSTKELALAGLKFKEFPGVTSSIHVVDMRQSLYFKQFFATLGRMGFDKEMTHLAYEFVTLKEGAMSSRKGNIVTYEDFRDEMTAMVASETRKRREDWDDAKVARTSWAVAEGAMKFGMLKQDNDRPITFDMEAALSFDGFTGPYVQYSHARLSSILAKADGETVSVCSASDDAKEFALLRLVADLPQIVVSAANAYRPSILAQYLFELAQASNDFYRDVPVLSAEPADRSRRLAIVAAARVALANGLALLGIRAPEEM